MSDIINCYHKEFPNDYRQKIDNVTQLQIIDDKKPITEKRSVISACNFDYRLKRSDQGLNYISCEIFHQIVEYIKVWKKVGNPTILTTSSSTTTKIH